MHYLSILPLLVLTMTGAAAAQGDCGSAAPLADGNHVGIAINTTGDTASGVTPLCGNATPMVDTWFSWSPTADSDCEFSLCNMSSYDSRMALYTACGMPEIDCNDDAFGCAGFTSLLQVDDLLDVSTYFLQVGGFNGATGTGQLDISQITLSAPLPNDTCATATALTAGANLLPWNTTMAQIEGTHLLTCTGASNPESPDVWFSWTPDVSGGWKFALCGSAFDTLIQVWDSCGAGAPLGCNDDSCGVQSELSLPGLVAGTTYYLQVGGFSPVSAGTGALDISALAAPPVNDDCAGATALPSGAQVGVFIDTSSAFASGVLPSCGGGTPPQDIWYSWTPGSSGDWQFTTCNMAAYDSRLALFSSCLGAELACNDDGPGCGLSTILDAPGLNGATTYYLQVGGFNANAGTAAMDIFQTGLPAEPGTDYCALTPNSAGPGANMTATGSSSVALNDLTLVCDNCPPNEPGVFFYGPSQIQVPFGEGNRCVGGTVTRLWPPIGIDAAGTVTRPVDNSTTPNVGVLVDTANLNFQFWFRDPAGGPFGFNLSNGYNIIFTP